MQKTFFKHGSAGNAYGTLSCHKSTDAAQRGVMKIFMQVPFEGSEYASTEYRAFEASKALSLDLDFHISSQIKALKTLISNSCQSVPSVVAIKYNRQEETDPVPGGPILFVLMKRLPGVPLSMAIFWNLEDSVREQIRQAFKCAWIDCVRSGIIPAFQAIEHVFWDAAANKAYITSFLMGEAPETNDIWRDSEWLAWDMAMTENFLTSLMDPNPHPDMSKRTL
ncbi:hypothetical protein BDV26DRAFT_290950 [Aspergillus bertholletiae]|uniref:Uncharacterized protein n=1 Tax=Aspergillus bertholletiae TaxID=1226010 RepID=A0A5N7BDL2_9EURO|nr:hypothetical protein BDV26DRAFT_290950 [Aspergillus bertholletiae]